MRDRYFKMIAIALLVAGCGRGGGDGSDSSPLAGPLPAPPPSAGQIGDGRVNEILEWARSFQGVPAMAMVLVRNGQIAEMGAVGRRSAEADVMVTEIDRRHLGSPTKALTATLAGMLVDESIISWQTRPIDVWPELDQDIHPSFRNITLKHLLSHTSDMERYDMRPIAIEDAEPGTAIEKRRAWAAELLSQAPIEPVGQYSYSNAGQLLAVNAGGDRANAAIDLVEDLILERFQASR